jgi:hypothetical protein
MPTLDVEIVRADDVTFVELLVEADRPHRVRVESRLDGPVWPPRTGGRPVEGWDAAGVSARVDAGTTPFGFATPAAPQGPVAELVAAEPVGPPEGVASWLRRVEKRVETAERLAAVEDLPAATRAVAEVGGLAGLEALAADLARDRRGLSRVGFAPDLAARAEAVDLPVGTFARLAHSASRRS